jgi:hypothetical protein
MLGSGTPGKRNLNRRKRRKQSGSKQEIPPEVSHWKIFLCYLRFLL